jgi:hypothetical protein
MQIIDVKQSELSSVIVSGYDWDDVNGYTRFEAEYRQGRKPIIMISAELWEDVSYLAFARPAKPKVGALVRIVDLYFKIIGFSPGYSTLEHKARYDIVLEKV